ncbi:PIN domain-containing protein [Methylocystis bryophila]|uniref:Ribonuclease VapC n=1 Tax=Methylocystis bryophila TaxID=655015 RepID=A0A1W6MQY8_9HYPH|nr:PIN domain-containing protein [Methylocystis bryophila]ARN79985.1 VapC toxin family PIN domain ribonuclease [Methylocystis bryophila]BDV39891.1 ribonuclease VapC [Methylocystis bryophila]
MIVLDTNVISELMRSAPNAAVRDWIAAQPRASLYTTSINCAEIFFGIRALPAGKRRAALAGAALSMFEQDFRGRILPVDARVAARYSEIVVTRRDAGAPIEAFDALIAATAAEAGAAVATRDVRGFQGCGVALIDPWQT